MRPSLRILVTADSAGSLWPYGLDLARGLSRLGHETVLALTGPAATDAQIRSATAIPGLRLVDTGLALDRTAEDEASLVRTAEGIALLADEVGADVVQLNTPALAALADFGQPVVAVLHSCVATWWETVQGTRLPDDFAWRTDLVAGGLRAAGEVVVPTAAFGDSVRRRYRLESAPRTVHHGRSPLAVPTGVPHDFVFTAGRLWDQGKNLGLLDSAAARIGVPVRAAGPIAGPNGGPVMFDNIHCLGTLDEAELGRCLSARPVFVSAALYEPFGLAVLEAASAGCALVLSDIPTFRELWDEVAIFVDPRDEDGFARAIGDLAGDDFERAVLGRAARERAARYTPDAMAAQMANIYRSLLPAIRHPVLAAARAA
ncbi:MAG TPA: glycosyltransferase family 4 protein [Allosphingosinicella sp.]|nr:glycosyltransferase family 4 protein [Allosphingosinicella sp.]